MDRALATKERPLLNQGLPYIPDAGRTMEDDTAIVYDAISSIRRRTHLSPQEFEKIYNDTITFFTVTERLQYKQYQSGCKNF